MRNKMNVLGVNVDCIDTEDAMKLTKEYMSNDYLNIVYFVGSISCVLAEKDPNFAQTINNSDIIIPGDKNIYETVRNSSLIRHKPINIGMYIKWAFALFEREYNNIYVIASDEKQLENFNNLVLAKRPGLKIKGNVINEINQDNCDIIANDINSETAYVVISLLQGNVQTEFVNATKQRISAKICLMTGDVVDELVAYDKELPILIEYLHLEKVYRWIIKRKKVNTTIISQIFRKRIKDNNNRKEN